MHRFYCPTLLHGTTVATLDHDQTHHARHVLRLSPGDELELFDGKGGVAQAILECFANPWAGAHPGARTNPGAGARAETTRGARVRILKTWEVAPPMPSIEVAAALPKGARATDMVSALSQLGADRFIPLRSARSVTDPKPIKLDRLRRVAIESARQCRRAYLLSLQEPASFEELPFDDYDTRLIALPSGGVPDDLGRQLRRANRVLLLVGPEGGWTEVELNSARNAGCLPWRLGLHVLRIETAAAAALAITQYMVLTSGPDAGGSAEESGKGQPAV